MSAGLSKPLARNVGLGPGDPAWLTLGALAACRAAGRAVAPGIPPPLVRALAAEGVEILASPAAETTLAPGGSGADVERFVAALDLRDLAIGVPGDPVSDLPSLPSLLRALEARGFRCEVVPGMPRATLAAPAHVPLVPRPSRNVVDWQGLVEVMARLRSGCPWDREQTHRSLVPYLIEESYEVADAIERDDDAGLCDELGDLLLQVVFHAQLATERGVFSAADVVDGLATKMMRRHPHVFGDDRAETVGEVWKNWEQLKALEPAAAARTSRLDGIPKGLGALQRAQKMQDKAARVGFDWPDLGGVRAKLAEEFDELDEARAGGDPERVRDELGDVFFSLVNLSRALGFDAEGALREASEKFRRRFAHMERRAADDGTTLGELSPQRLDELWRAAKSGA